MKFLRLFWYTFYSIRYTLCILQYTLYSAHYTVYIIQYTIYSKSIHYTVYIISIHCTVYSIHCTVYIVQYTVYSIHCTVYIIQYTLYSIHCTVYSIHYTVYSIHYTLYSIQQMKPWKGNKCINLNKIFVEFSSHAERIENERSTFPYIPTGRKMLLGLRKWWTDQHWRNGTNLYGLYSVVMI